MVCFYEHQLSQVEGVLHGWEAGARQAPVPAELACGYSAEGRQALLASHAAGVMALLGGVRQHLGSMLGRAREVQQRIAAHEGLEQPASSAVVQQSAARSARSAVASFDNSADLDSSNNSEIEYYSSGGEIDMLTEY